ncbi:MAG: bifunctional phosphopantothenoylcysteine decarboxylase/phosphopantothenate--cysteine ligase CoaBC [Bernardetiaceae bacterium]|nr:bifunctional phosphopantothenoylcysteine decarboxylase/phosphopantothenate--cysteine ligase CoaBC [Bernardetiaceae bacterium]
MWKNKKIILAITGGIAAYKMTTLTRLLIKAGAQVQVVMSPEAHTFVTPLTLATLSKNPVLTDFQADKRSGTWNNHVELGLWADIMLIAPATANTLAKMANGLCDNLLMAVYLSARCPVFFAPAMDLDMYQHFSVKQNISKLTTHGNHLIPPAYGELASGLKGEGRLAEPEYIFKELENYWLSQNKSDFWKDKKVMLTAGPTREAIDPVRFISNHSSGKMGYAIANQLAKLGAEVHLISGPSQEVADGNIKIKQVESAQEMYLASIKIFPQCHIAILAAAVSDYTPAEKATKKIKKKSEDMHISLIKTPDIAAELGKIKKQGQCNIGFALETDNELKNAQGKLERKNFDLIVLNSLQDAGAGFGHDTNRIKIIDRKGQIQNFALKSKAEVAQDIINQIEKTYQNP